MKIDVFSNRTQSLKRNVHSFIHGKQYLSQKGFVQEEEEGSHEHTQRKS